MAMVVKNNMSAVRTLNTLNSNTNALQKSLQKVSSGMKINSAQDDASGYAISERMRVRIRSLDQANQNTQNDSSLMKTAEGAVGNTVEILRALKEKAINAANDSNTDEDRQTIQKEINQFIDQIDDNALVQFNGKYLIDGSKNNASTASKTILLNQSLRSDTLESTKLTDLYNRAGDSLSIQTTDKWQVSWVENGNINFTSGTVGDKSLAAILNTAWKTTDEAGDEIYFGKVSATTAEGLISSAKEFKNLGKTDANGTTPDAIADIVMNYKGFDSTKDGTFTFAELGLYADAEGSTTFTLSDGSTVDSSALTITYTPPTTAGTDPTAADFQIQGTIASAEGADTVIYGLKVQAGSINATDVGLTSTEVQSGFTVPSDPTTLTGFKLVARNLVAGFSGIGDTTAPGVNAQPVTRTATPVSLTTLTATNDAGETIPKYYIKNSDGEFEAANILVNREQVWTANSAGNAMTLTSDNITFTNAADGSALDTSVTAIYEYAGDSTEGTGFNDAWDKFGKAVYTPDKTPGIAVAATTEGVDKQISGLTISILDQDGNVKKAANAALDQFKQYQRAENRTGDMSLNFHIGSEANVAIKVGMSDMRSQALGLKGSDGTRINVFTKENANSAINVIENALTKALDQQTTIGAIEARLEYTSTNLTTSSENVQAAESTIRDADMAKEMTNYTKSNVLLQAAQAMLAQANQNSSAVLSLLQ